MGDDVRKETDGDLIGILETVVARVRFPDSMDIAPGKIALARRFDAAHDESFDQV